MLVHSLFWVLLLSLVSAANTTLLDDILKAFTGAVECTSCHGLLMPLKLLSLAGDTVFVNTFTDICMSAKLQDEDVCRGVIAEEGPILAHVLRGIDPEGDTATKLCEAVFGLCKPPPVKPYTMKFPKPAPPHSIAPAKSGKGPLKVLHISDAHVDREYTPGSEAACNKPICCRNFQDGLGKPIAHPANPNGEHTCDAPVTVLNSMFDAAKAFVSDAAFTVFTGDVVDSSVWLVNEASNTKDIHAFNADLAAKIGMPVYGAVGNHEAAPVNSFPRSTTNTSLSSQWVFDALGADWARWIGAPAADHVVHHSGSYSVKVQGTNLRIISLNTIYWYKLNFWLLDSDQFQPDPNGMLAFLIDNLQAAEDAGERVWIIGHLSPGVSDTLRDQSNYYNQIVQRYKNTIAASFFGHTHKDHFEIAYSDYNSRTSASASSVAFLAPALTTRNGNPGFKVYEIDADTYEVMDFTVFIANMSTPSFSQKITWGKYYSARESYGPLLKLSPSQPFNAAVMHNLTDILEKDDATFAAFYERYSRGFEQTKCTGDCQANIICQLRAMRGENNCYEPTAGVHFQRRDYAAATPDPFGSHCEGSGIKLILQSMIGNNVTVMAHP